MKKGLVVFFAFILLLRGFGLVMEGLAMIPSLLAHFHTHHHHSLQDHGEDLSFFDFFIQHYGNGNHHDDEGRDHANLPFSHTGKLCADFESLPIKSICTHGAFLACHAESRGALDWNFFYSHLYLRDIFRPPLA